MVRLKIYGEQVPYAYRNHPFNYMVDDVLYRLPWFMGDPEPPLRVLYPIIRTLDDGTEVIDPLTIYIGRTAGKRPFAYNPRYVVNPLILVVGTPGAGKSLPPDQEIIVVRNGEPRIVRIKEVKLGDYVVALPLGSIEYNLAKFSRVIGVHEMHHRSRVVRVVLESGREIVATPDHSFIVVENGRLVSRRGAELRAGDIIPTLTERQVEAILSGDVALNDRFIPWYEKVSRIVFDEYTGPVYDIETEENTFMTAQGIFVHNSATLKTFIYNFIWNTIVATAVSERGTRPPPVIVIDPEGEYAILRQFIDPSDVLHLKLGRGDYINIFDRPSKTIDPFAWYKRMLAVVQKFLHISAAQAAQAYRVLDQAINALAKERGFTTDPSTWRREDITLEDVYKWISDKIDSLEKQRKMTTAQRRFYQGALTLKMRLDHWMHPPNDAFSKKSSIDLAKVFRYRLVVLDARGLARDLFGLFTYWIVYWLYGMMLEKGPLPEFGIRVVLVIDEAWALLRKTESREEENPLEALARRGRKYGIMIVVATQTPEDVDEKMFSLFGTLVTGIIPSDKMASKIVKSRGMPKHFEDIIKSLSQGQLIWSINWREKKFPMSRMPIIVHSDYPIRGVKQIEFF